MRKELITTADGSHSIFLPDLSEHYHSKHGAIAESQHIFIKNGFDEIRKEKEYIKILEVGMGTGLNVLTTYLANNKPSINVEMHTIEAFPLSWDELKHINYAQILKVKQAFFKAIHLASFGKPIALNNCFSLLKHKTSLQEFDFVNYHSFDLIYFDAFAPEKQPEIWEYDCFNAIFNNTLY